MTDRNAFSTRVEAIEWQNVNPDGTKSATVVGTREAGVAFSYAFFIPAGVWDAPHSHLAVAHLVVARGELHLGYGSELDREAAEIFPAGSSCTCPPAPFTSTGPSATPSCWGQRSVRGPPTT